MITHISNSSLGMWLRCGEQFRRRYIEGEIIPPGISARTGTAVHKASDINFSQKIITKKDMPLSDLQDAARDNYVHTVKESGVFIPKDKLSEKKKLLNDGLNSSLEATKVYREDIAPKIQPLFSEHRLEADIGLGIPLLGIIDCYDGCLNDLKVAKKKNQTWADNELQASFYSVLAEKNYLNGDTFKYHFVVPNKTMVYEEISTKRDKKDWEVLTIYIKAFLADLKIGNFKPADRGHWVCNPLWCGYYLTCKFVGN